MVMFSALALLTFLALATDAIARSVYVSPSGSDTASGSKTDPLRTVSQGVTAAGAGGEVHVLPGVYTSLPSINVPGVSILAYPASSDAAKTHVFSGLNKYPSSMVVVNKNKTTIRGFGFTQSRCSPSYGIVYVATNGEVSLEECSFSDNSIGVSTIGGNVSISSCRFETALSTQGSGTGVQFMYHDFGGGGNVSIKNTTFTGKSGTGTGISLNDGPCTLSVVNATFRNLRIGVTSGGLSRPFAAKLDHCVFTNVTQGINHYGMSQSAHGTMDIRASTFDKCGSETTKGGAVYAGTDVSVTIEQSRFSNNVGQQGAALSCGDSASFSVIGNTFTSNKAEDGSPAWCDKNCGFVGSNNQQSRNTNKTNTGHCSGLDA